MANWFRSRPRLSIFLGVLAGIIILLFLLALRPFSLEETFSPNPAQSFDEALERIEAIQAEEANLDLHPECASQLQSHGEKTEKVIVFLHGFTSCPQQFAELGKEFYKRGYNVYIPRTPRHGFDNRRGEPLKGLTAEEMAEFAHHTVDIAQGLGEQVIVSGISGGGAMATYLSQEREDVDIAAPIAPFLGIGFVPRPLNRSFANLFLIVPDFWQWWDPIHRENNPLAAPFAYARYPLHALLENMRLGYAAEADAKRVRPAADQIIIITNANDESVNNAVVAEFEQMWSDHGDELLVNFQFEKSQGLPHDLITPTRPGARVDLVYPKLLELIHGETTAPPAASEQEATVLSKSIEGSALSGERAPEGSDPAKLAEILGNLSYSGLFPEQQITLTDGYYYYSEGGVGTPHVRLIEHLILLGDLNEDGAQDAVLLLEDDSEGTGRFTFLVAVLNVWTKPVPVEALMIGDRIGVKTLTLDGTQVVMDVVAQGPGDTDCCASWNMHLVYSLEDGRLVEKSRTELNRISLADLDGTTWRLVDLNLDQEPVLPETEITLHFDNGQISGFAGCNEYTGAAESGEYGLNSIKVSPIAATRMLCPDAVSAQENTYLTRLATAGSWHYDYGYLSLFYKLGEDVVGELLFAPET